MNGIDNRQDEATVAREWEGLAELDRALTENRVTEYRIKKAWADPLVRASGLLVGGLFTAYIAFVVYWDVIRP